MAKVIMDLNRESIALQANPKGPFHSLNFSLVVVPDRVFRGGRSDCFLAGCWFRFCKIFSATKNDPLKLSFIFLKPKYRRRACQMSQSFWAISTMKQAYVFEATFQIPMPPRALARGRASKVQLSLVHVAGIAWKGLFFFCCW